jgi:hypothetical protein
MSGRNWRHSRKIGSIDVEHPVALQQQSRPTDGEAGRAEQDDDDDARKHCLLDASMLGLSLVVDCVLFHGQANAHAPRPSLTRSRRYGSSRALSEGRWHGWRPSEAEQASSQDWPEPAINQPESRAAASGRKRANAARVTEVHEDM